MRTGLLPLLSAAALSVALAAGCAATAPAAQPPAPAAQPPAPAAQTPVPAPPAGTYRNENTPHGAVTIHLGPSTYTVDVPYFGIVIHGTITTNPQGVIFTENPGGGADCPGVPGLYTATIKSDRLTLVKIQDNCQARTDDFPSGPWIEQH